MRRIAVIAVVMGIAATAGAQPNAGSGSAAPAPIMTPPPPAGGELQTQCAQLAKAEPKWFRETCTAAIQADKDWNADLFEEVRKWNATQLLEQTDAAHQADAKAIATNKKHVVGAYAAMWLVAVVFLVMLWRRQQGLVTQIAQLKRDLDAALKDEKK